MPLITSLIASLTAVIGLVLGWRLSRWQKHGEIIYVRKVDVYADIARSLTDIQASHADGSPQLFDDFSDLYLQLTRARLFMPEALYDDFSEKLRSTASGIAVLSEVHDCGLSFLRLMKYASNPEIVQPEFIKHFEGEGQQRLVREVFAPLINETPELIRMLKRDLGIEEIGRGFYKKKPFADP